MEKLKADKEIDELRKQLFEKTGKMICFNYECYLSIEEYKEHLRECVKAGKLITRLKDKEVRCRFNSVLKKHF